MPQTDDPALMTDGDPVPGGVKSPPGRRRRLRRRVEARVDRRGPANWDLASLFLLASAFMRVPEERILDYPQVSNALLGMRTDKTPAQMEKLLGLLNRSKHPTEFDTNLSLGDRDWHWWEIAVVALSPRISIDYDTPRLYQPRYDRLHDTILTHESPFACLLTGTRGTRAFQDVLGFSVRGTMDFLRDLRDRRDRVVAILERIDPALSAQKRHFARDKARFLHWLRRQKQGKTGVRPVPAWIRGKNGKFFLGPAYEQLLRLDINRLRGFVTERPRTRLFTWSTLAHNRICSGLRRNPCLFATNPKMTLGPRALRLSKALRLRLLREEAKVPPLTGISYKTPPKWWEVPKPRMIYPPGFPRSKTVKCSILDDIRRLEQGIPDDERL